MDEPILYTQTDCADNVAESARVRAWLAGRGIPFTERVVTGDLAAAEALAATGVFATPLLVVGADAVLGFRPRALAALQAEGRLGDGTHRCERRVA